MTSNAWVESYLDLLLRDESRVAGGAFGDASPFESQEAISQARAYKNFYVQQILSMKEDEIAESFLGNVSSSWI